MRRIVLLIFGFFPAFLTAGEPTKPPTESGIVHFHPSKSQEEIPTRYQLKPNHFSYKLIKKKEYKLSGFTIHHLTFPSPFKSPHPENNTVHADYYLPTRSEGKVPGVIVLHITGGDQELSRLISSHLAANGVAALFVQMAYYGPRRPKGSRLRLLSYDFDHSIRAVRQTVLDVRRATAWLESRKELDHDRLGILGTSLGGFMAALSAEMEPKLDRVVILLAGGGFADGFYDHPKAMPYRLAWELMGGTKGMVKKMLAPVDPLTCAGNLKSRKVLMISASKDEIVHPKMAKALWQASGKQKIIWINAGHYTAALYIAPIMKQALDHLKGK